MPGSSWQRPLARCGCSRRWPSLGSGSARLVARARNRRRRTPAVPDGVVPWTNEVDPDGICRGYLYVALSSPATFATG
jgi:hypothetical protein